MDRPGFRGGGVGFLLVSAVIALGTGSCGTTSSPRTTLELNTATPVLSKELKVQPAADPVQEKLSKAEQYYQEDLFDLAREILNPLSQNTDSPAYADVLFLRARIAKQEGQFELAQFYLRQILAKNPGRLRFSVYLFLSDLRYELKDFDGAYRYYLEAQGSVPAGAQVPARVWLRLAEIALYVLKDPDRARYHLRPIAAAALTNEEHELRSRLVRRLQWQALKPDTIGLDDGNISALRIDGDDLWVGTWNGGIVRYSLSSGEKKVFKEGRESLSANTVRSIEVTRSRIWIGTYQGLFVYSKPTSQWQEIGMFGGANPKKVEAIKAVGNRIYLGTLGDGLWRYADQGWARLSAKGLPGDFISCLEVSLSMLLIGTLNHGIILMDLSDNSFRSFDELASNFEARNITMLLAESAETLWVGTYGMGLYRWNWKEKTLEHYARESGQIEDNWVLSGLKADSGLYFGTFGGGVARFSDKKSTWESFGLHQGLPSPDISALAYSSPYLFLGTLGAGISVLWEEYLDREL